VDFYSIKVALGQLDGLIGPVRESLDRAEDEFKDIKELSAKKLEMETAYRQAHAEREQIAEGIKNLKAQLAEEQKSYAKSSAEMIVKHAADVSAAQQHAQESLSKIAAEHHAQCVSLAKKKSELQAEVVALEKKISDHKQYIKAAQARLA
jgi:translation elongation factor EF-1beta